MVYGSSLKEHDKRLKAVLERLELHEVVLNLAKCLLGVRSIEFDDYLITDMGVRPLSSNVDGLRKLTAPVGFYMTFIPHFAEICPLPVDPLLQYISAMSTKARGRMGVDSKAPRSILLSAICNYICNYSRVLWPKSRDYLATDASAVALSACFSARHYGQKRPVAFASRCVIVY